MAGYDFLSTTHINGIWPDLFFALQQNQDLRWTQGVKGDGQARIPIRDSSMAEIHARISDRFVIAPIIGRGQGAPMRTPNTVVRLEQTTIPKIKHGMMFDEGMLRMLDRIESSLAGVPAIGGNNDAQTFLNYEGNQLMNLMLGVSARIEHMAVGMLLDTYTYTADKGITFTMTWGAPSDAKVTVGTSWGNGTAGTANAAPTATPVSDVQTLLTGLLTNYGAEFNRLTMSRQAFDYIVGTNEFKAQAPLFYGVAGLAPTFGAIQSSNREHMRQVFSRMINMEVEFDDRQVMVEQPDLTLFNAPPATPAVGQYIRYQPVNKVILTNTTNDGDINVWDIANLPVMEAERGMVPGMVGTAPSGGARGPFGYASALSISGDPPGKALFAVQEALPEKKFLLASAVLTVF